MAQNVTSEWGLMSQRAKFAAVACMISALLVGCSSQSSDMDEFDGDQISQNQDADDGHADAGTYQGEYLDVDDSHNRGTVTFELVDGKITDFHADPLALCSDPNALNGIETRAVVVSVDEIAVSADGSFDYTHTETAEAVNDKQTFHVEGRIDGGDVQNGMIELSDQCEVTASFTAART